MAKISRKAGSTGLIIEVFVNSTASTTGAGLTGVAFNASGLSCYYKRNTAASGVQATLSGISTFGTYAGGSGFGAWGEVSASGMPGIYEFHIPNNAVAAGADSVVFWMGGASGMAPLLTEIELTGVDNQNATTYGIAALPSFAPNVSGGLMTFGVGSGQIYPVSGQVAAYSIPPVTATVNTTTIASGVWGYPRTDATVSGSFGKDLSAFLSLYVGPGTGSGPAGNFYSQLLGLLFQNAAVPNIGDASGLQPSASAGSYYLSLHTANPLGGNQSTSETTYTGYSRVAVARTTAGWSIATNVVSNVAQVLFGAVSAGTGTITHLGIGSSSSGAGTLNYVLPLASSFTIAAGNQPTFNAGGITITFS